VLSSDSSNVECTGCIPFGVNDHGDYLQRINMH
jgi:hypothetical protein